nr:hypothetical protein [Streptomyces sp. AC602_WCS936]
MKEIEAVGGGLSGAGGVLAPEPCSLIGVRQMQVAGKGEGAAGLGDLIGEEGGDGGGRGVSEKGCAQGAQVFGRLVE